jgi:GMP synthase-like glutamine amidotransferase
VRVLFVQQDHVSPVGPVGDAFAAKGWDVVEFLVVPPERFSRPDVTVTFPEPGAFDAVVPMGAPWSVNDRDTLPWIDAELELLRAADAAGVPVLGICFGGQALAAAHGGAVERAPRPEIGWTVVDTDDETLVAAGPWFEWHHDRWLLPPGAVEIARTSQASQAFVLRRNLAVQFHPELTGAQLGAWLANGGATYLEQHQVEVARLQADTVDHEAAAARRTAALVDAFLTRVVAPAARGRT